MKILILGANGFLGPHVVKALEGEHTLRLTDINELDDTPHEYLKVDVADLDQVVAAAEGMDAIINLSVLRYDRQVAFDVNARGCYNMMTAAVRHGIRRVINTGPHYTITGPTYEQLDYQIGPDVPPHPGTYPYAITKSLGQEICKVFTENHDVYVMALLFYHFRQPDDHDRDGEDFIAPFTVTWGDAAQAFRPALSIDLSQLPSRCERFFVFTDLPHQQFSNEKIKRVLGWRPTDQMEHSWRRKG